MKHVPGEFLMELHEDGTITANGNPINERQTLQLVENLLVNAGFAEYKFRETKKGVSSSYKLKDVDP